MHVLNSLVLGIPLLGTTTTVVGLMLRHVRQQRQASLKLAEAQASGSDVPVSLHPVIDANACICSGACMTVCPEGGVIQIVNGTARLVEATQCIGHGVCAQVCPVKAIKLVFGSARRGVDLPDVSPTFESSRPGVHIAGELGGMGLIKNAMTQGLQAADAVHDSLGPVNPARSDTVDVAIVGAGPAGLATAIGLQRRRRSFALLEQGSFGGAVANYPRHKVVMTDTVPLPFYGEFGQERIVKEDLLGMMRAAADAADVRVNEHVRVLGIDGEDGAFCLRTSAGPVKARKVVLAMGRRGTPRKLGVPGETLPNVTYALIDPTQYNQRRVLVVGSGDSAMESAIMLAEESSATVYISVRSESFGGRRANREHIQGLVAEGRVRVLYCSEVRRIAPDHVRLHRQGETLTLAADFVVVNIGGTLPSAFLAEQNIAMRTHFGTEAQPVPRPTTGTQKAQRVQAWAELSKYILVVSLAFAFMGLVALAMRGMHYYRAPVALRPGSPLHKLLRPAGSIGRAVGLVATLMMMLNFAYAVRKRVARLKGFGNLTDWLNMHMLLGATTPLFVAFHAAFQSNNAVASGTAGALAVVVGTGIFGRFLFSLVPMVDSQPVALADLLTAWEQVRARLQDQAGALTTTQQLHILDMHFARAQAPSASESLWNTLQACRELRRLAHQMRGLLHAPGAAHDVSQTISRLVALRLQIGIYERMRRALTVWRVLHIALSGLLVMIMALHIGLAVYLGYGKFF